MPSNLSKRPVWMVICAVLVLGAGGIFVSRGERKKSEPREAMFYQKLDDKKVWCKLCPHKCIIPEGTRGICGNKENRDGKLYLITHSKPCSIGLEPIEKAPFYHFKPGHTRFVIATRGCNLRCKFCQNWNISQRPFEQVRHYELSPEEIVELALKKKAYSICFTFSEPISYYEYMYDIAKLAKKKGLKTAMVSNGFINPKPLKELLTVLDVVKIDLKAFTDEFYGKMCTGELEPVLESLKIVKKSGTWLEIVNLVIPTLNDDPKEIRQMCEWIKKELGPDVPLHFLRFGPAFKLTKVPPTPVSTLEKAFEIAKETGLNYVYLGNVPGHIHNNTVCPKCGKLLIKRVGFQILENNIKDGKCKFCGHEIKGFWK